MYMVHVHPSSMDHLIVLLCIQSADIYQYSSIDTALQDRLLLIVYTNSIRTNKGAIVIVM